MDGKELWDMVIMAYHTDLSLQGNEEQELVG